MTPIASRKRRASPRNRTSTRRNSAFSSIRNDPEVIEQARADGIAGELAGGRAPFAGLQDGDGVEGRVPAPPGISHAANGLVRAAAVADPVGGAAGKIGHDGEMPDVRSLRIPLKYLANLLTAGKEEPVALGLERMLAMRAYMRAKTVDGVIDEAIAKRVGLTALAIEDMYQTMAIANYEDRFVIPTAHREINEDAYDLRGSCGFSFGNGCSGGTTEANLFGTPKRAKTPMEVV